MTTRKYHSVGNHLPGLLIALALVSLICDTALARTPARKSLARAAMTSNAPEAANPAALGLILAERPRRVTVSESALNLQLPWTSDVLYKSMPKAFGDRGHAIQAGAVRVLVKPLVSLDTWPGFSFRDAWAAGSAIASPAPSLADRTPRPIRVSNLIESMADLSASGSPAGAPGQKRSGTVSTAPMTAGEKFTYFLRKSFMPPTPYALSVLGGVFGEALDTKDKKHRNDAGEFLADSMTRAARSFAFRSTANFFEKFAYATMFKQDPRYHRSNNTGFGARVGYAISRIFVTQGDRGGRQFNASFIVGGLSAAGMSNLWVRDEHMNVGDTFVRWGEHVGLTALSNIVREFIGGQ